jgi:hypothetical protein
MVIALFAFLPKREKKVLVFFPGIATELVIHRPAANNYRKNI